MNNEAVVYDKHGNDWLYVSPDGYDLELIYRDDQSIRIQAYGSNTDKVVAVAEWATGEWSHASFKEATD